MGIWEAMEKLSELVDDSDPDVCVFRPLHCLLFAHSSTTLPHHAHVRFSVRSSPVHVASFFSPFSSQNPSIASTNLFLDALIGCFDPCSHSHTPTITSIRIGILISPTRYLAF